ncbi:MAG: cation:proton antiporter [Polyangiaceae bacterium]|nr:cation:proton antiporter [Polyangiaceae bacterium]
MQLAVLLLQIAVILVAIRLVGWVFRKFHQPQVVGEMIAGVLLGPSVFGAVAPKLSGAIFSEKSLPFINSLSQIGLVLFLFLVGLVHDPKSMKGRGATAVITSHASITIPFALGAALAIFLYPRLSDDSVTFTQFALFMGTGMSITAFPVLARILEEEKLVNTTVGAAATVCAAVDDVTGWLVVAGVLLLVHAEGAHAPFWVAVPGTVAYAIFMLTGARRLFRPFASAFAKRGELSHDLFASVLLVALLSAYLTERMGVHPLFGAFLAGIAMPKDPDFVRALSQRMEDLTVVLFLPLFFVFSGLRTRIGLLSGGETWIYFLAVFAVAVAGKLGGAALAARSTGFPWREATSLGVLVNARGLVELVVLNIGLDAGLVSPALFAILVLVAIVTTLMTTPLLDLTYPPRLRHATA